MSGLRGAAVAAMMCLVAGCRQSPEQVVTGTSHCTEVKLSPQLTMRLSAYYGSPDSDRHWVVQACHPSGTACSPILTYDHAMGPVYALDGNVVTVGLLGGSEPRVHQRRVELGPIGYVFVPRRITGPVSKSGQRLFRSRIQHHCPASNRQFPA